MSKRRSWTDSEVTWLLANAGKLSQAELSRSLNRSPEAIKQKAKTLKARGHEISLYHAKTVLCPSCGKARSRITFEGKCRVCVIKDLLQSCDVEMARILQKLPPERRAIYERTEHMIKSRTEPIPSKPITREMSIYKATKQYEAYALEVEQIEIRNLTRKLKAKRRRIERMREYIDM